MAFAVIMAVLTRARSPAEGTMPAPLSSQVDPAIGHLAALAEDAGEGPPGLLAALAKVAEHYARYAVRDLRRAVLMAAIACEVKLKETLRRCATDAQQSLVDFALDNPHEVTVTAADGLFDKLMLATLGRSLRKEDTPLFKDIQRLYKVRNAITHRGTMPDEADVGCVVRAARRCFIWPDSLAQALRLDGSGADDKHK
jgi:hypothetical protein